ncbi:MAG: hypothetical protein IPM83_10645 [Ignavibacteria bacterium]|nr:hypothetical protein [Ignavibacteria bacterium]
MKKSPTILVITNDTLILASWSGWRAAEMNLLKSETDVVVYDVVVEVGFLDFEQRLNVNLYARPDRS